MATPADDYARIILEGMRALLKPAGFRKEGHRFTVERNDVTQRIQLQRSTSSTRDHVRVTVNLEVYSKPLTLALGDADLTWMFVRGPHWGERIGALSPRRQDQWWEVHSEAGAEEAAREITDLLFRYALPALAALDSTEKLRKLWGGAPSPSGSYFTCQRYLDALKERELAR
jgi:hypothetical protein